MSLCFNLFSTNVIGRFYTSCFAGGALESTNITLVSFQLELLKFLQYGAYEIFRR